MENKAPILPGGGSLQENLNIRYYWQVLLERRWLFITAFVSVFILCLIYLYKAPRIFQAVATIQIDREIDNVVNIRDVLSMESREQDYLQTQYKNLQSRSLIEKVVAKLQLAKDPRYIKAPDKPKAVAEDITIAPVRLTRLVEVKVEHTDAKRAALIANELADTFIDNNMDVKKMESKKSLDNLDNEIEIQKGKVAQCENALQLYKESISNVSVESTENITLQALRIAQERLAYAESSAALARKLDEEVQGLLTNNVRMEDISQVAGSRVIQDLKAALSAHLSELAGLTNRYLEQYPLMEEKRQTISSIQNAIKMEAERIVAAIHNDAKIAEGQAETMRDYVKTWEQKQLRLGTQRVTYDDLFRKANVQKQLYTKVLESHQDLVILMNNKVNNIHVRDRAWETLKPIKPKIVLTLLMGVVGGFAVGIGLALFANYLDDSIKSQDDVEVHLHQTFLGYVPNIKTNSVIERDLQAHLQPQSTAAEGFRTIRAAVSLMPKSDQFRVLVVTSTIPSEGKSLLASNLAIVTAQTGLRTVLVDADMRRPSVHKAFQLHSPNGLSAYLLGTAETLDQIIHDTEVPNLDVVCAGAIPHNPSELAGSKRMQQFLKELSQRYDRVFLDCPPVSAVSDPLVIAAQADGAIFVTKFNKIRREHARKSIQRLEDAGVRIIGVALNDIDFEGKDSYYYSYYYYQNRYYSSHYKTQPTVKSDPKAEPVEKG